MKLKPWIGHRVREIFVHLTWFFQPKSDLTVAIFPSGDKSQGSSNLRAIEIGKALTKLGWRVSVVPMQLEYSQRLRILQLQKPKVIFLQKARHSLNRPGLYQNIPIVFDIDDADYLDPLQYDGIVDCLSASKAVIAGSSIVANWCKAFNSSVDVVWTGTPVAIAANEAIPSAKRAPIVAWACSMSLGYPVEAEFVVNTLVLLAERINFEFWLYGVDSEPQADLLFGRLREKGIALRYFNFMPYQNFINSLGAVSVGLNPLLPEQSAYSQGKSFGKVLAYLVANVAIVASDAVDHRGFFEHKKNGMLADRSEEWVESIYELLVNSDLRQSLVENAYNDYCTKLTTEVAAKKVSTILSAVISNYDPKKHQS